MRSRERLNENNLRKFPGRLAFRDYGVITDSAHLDLQLGVRLMPKLNVHCLESRDTPAFLSGAEIVVGADAGSPALVRLIDPATQIEQATFLAFDANFYGGVRVAVGDVTGDGYPDLICAAGPSGGPVIKIYDGQTGATSSFFAYGSGFTGGVNIATGDVNGDGVDEIITGAGASGGPQVTVFNASGTALFNFFAYQSEVRSGVRVAAGDVTGDGKADIVTGPGYGGGPDIRVFDLTTGGSVRPRNGFFAYGSSFTGGVYVAAGDVDGDGVAEIVTGAGPGGAPQVSVFEGGGQQINSFFAYGTDFLGGVRVSTAQLTTDKQAQILTVAGTGGASQVNVYNVPNANPITSMFAFRMNQTTGFFIAGSPERLNIPSTPAATVDNAYANLQPATQATQPLTPITTTTQPYAYNDQYYSSYPWWWYGTGLGLGGFGGFGGFGGYYGGYYGPSYFDAPGLYAPLNSFYAPTFFDEPTYFDPGYYDPGTTFDDPGYYDPSGYPIDSNYYDTGFSDGFFDDGSFTGSGGFGSDYGFDDYGFDDYGFGGGFFDF